MKGEYIWFHIQMQRAICSLPARVCWLMLQLSWEETALGWYLSDICLQGWVAPGETYWHYCHSDPLPWHEQIIPISHLSLPFTGSTRGWDWTNTARGDCKFWPKSNCVWCVSPSVPWHHSLLYSLWPVAVSNDQGFVSFTVSPGQWRWYCQAV